MKNLECLVTYVDHEKSIDDENKLKIKIVYGFSIFNEDYQNDELLNTALSELEKIKKHFKLENKECYLVLLTNKFMSGSSEFTFEKSEYVPKNMFYIRIYA